MALPMVMGAVQGLAGIAGGIIGSKKRKQEERAAQAEYNRTKQALFDQDTSNVYENMENTMEDLTVNTQQADFLAQQQQQALANTMNNMQGAAGGSGIAAMAQALAGQQSANLARSSISIGQQESQNQMLAAREASKLQGLEARGELISREQEDQKRRLQLGMAQQRLGAAKAARQAATKSIIGGVTGLASAGLGAAASGAKAAGRGMFEDFGKNIKAGFGF